MSMDWATLLRSQQADFLQRLKSGHLLHCETEGQHSELTVISGERLKQLRDFCWQMADKCKLTSPVRDVFINNLKGKLGEEVVKARLGNFVTEVDYQKRIGGDGKVDFKLTSDANVGIQVKARHSSIHTVEWSVSPEEIEKNAALVCILIQEEVNEAQSKYNLILAGFLPTSMIEVSNSKVLLNIDELLYGGGLRCYLERLKYLGFEDLRHQESKSQKPKTEGVLTSGLANNKPIKRNSIGSDTDGLQVQKNQPSNPKQEYQTTLKPNLKQNLKQIDKPVKRQAVSKQSDDDCPF